MSDTITAISTATGVSSISIVRVSGKDALKIASKVAPKADPTPREAILTPFFDKDGVVIDQGILIYFQAPKSFTGEDIVEFQAHGGIVIAQEILESTISAGARIAEAGEFSKRAFLNGKIDLSEAEAIAKMIEAKSADAVKVLAKLLRGDLKRFVESIKERLLGAIAYSEVMIDYAEEDIPADTMEALIKRVESLKSSLEDILDSSLRRKGLIEGFKLAIVGKPNVGKSSLLNSILNYERAIVSSIAGTTRDTIEESIRVGSHIIRVVDTAGIRDAVDEIESIGVSRSLKSIDEADIVVALFDSSREFDEDDREILEILKSLKDKNVIILLSKSDLEPKLELEYLKEFDPIAVSKENIKPFLNRLKSILDEFNFDGELILGSSRQIEIIEDTIKSVESSIAPLRAGELEFVSFHLQDAISKISQLTNPYESEQILDKMFSEFCLGK